MPDTDPSELDAGALRVSPSGLELWTRCQRAWAFRYIERIQVPSGDKANLGSRCHAIAEAYLRDGTAPNHAERITLIAHGSPRVYYPGRIVANILHHLPPAGSVPRIEERCDFRYRGVEFTGYVDWQTDTHIGDHKFTSDISYAKKPADLRTDPQGVIYRTARWLESDQQAVTLQWTYGAFDHRASKVVQLPVVREFASIDSFLPTIEGMAKAKATVTEANTLPATGLTHRPKIACEMYGGCPYIDKCNRTSIQVHKGKLGAYMASSVLDRLRAKHGVTNAAPSTQAVPSNGATPAHTGAGNGRAAPAPAIAAGSVNPPGEAHDPIPATPAPTPAAAAPTDPPAVRRKRGRPPKYPPPAPAATTTTTAPVSTVEPTADTGAPVVPTATDTEAPAAGVLIGTLYVNCRPVRGGESVCDGFELIDTAHKLVCEDQNVAHYKFLDFGKGPGALSVALGLVIADRGYMPAVYVNTESAEAQDVIQVLNAASGVIVVGK